jgi:hypothetical protein
MRPDSPALVNRCSEQLTAAGVPPLRAAQIALELHDARAIALTPTGDVHVRVNDDRAFNLAVKLAPQLLDASSMPSATDAQRIRRAQVRQKQILSRYTEDEWGNVIERDDGPEAA